MCNQTLPDVVRTDEELDELLSRPGPALIEMMKRMEGDLLILGSGGKIGVSLARTAMRAIEAAGVKKKVIGVDLFPDSVARDLLDSYGVETVQCNLLDRAAVAQLPQVKNVIFMAGRKFGTTGAVELTWAMNALVPANAAAHYRHSRIVAFSTGCIYPLVPVEKGGCTEDVAPGPIGEYAQSCLARERVFGYHSQADKTEVCMFRLNYSVELRYGVLFDIAVKVKDGEPVDLNVGQFNVLWQGDVNNQALLSLDLCASPCAKINVTGPETLSTRQVAEEFGRLMGKEVTFTGEEGPVGYLSNSARATDLFGYPSISPRRVIKWTADWLMQGGRSLGKPTHFEVSNGKY